MTSRQQWVEKESIRGSEPMSRKGRNKESEIRPWWNHELLCNLKRPLISTDQQVYGSYPFAYSFQLCKLNPFLSCFISKFDRDNSTPPPSLPPSLPLSVRWIESHYLSILISSDNRYNWLDGCFAGFFFYFFLFSGQCQDCPGRNAIEMNSHETNECY